MLAREVEGGWSMARIGMSIIELQNSLLTFLRSCNVYKAGIMALHPRPVMLLTNGSRDPARRDYLSKHGWDYNKQAYCRPD